MTEQEFRELEMKLWRELGEQRKKEREQAREALALIECDKIDERDLEQLRESEREGENAGL